MREALGNGSLERLAEWVIYPVVDRVTKRS
jgi:hypothetical protein